MIRFFLFTLCFALSGALFSQEAQSVADIQSKLDLLEDGSELKPVLESALVSAKSKVASEASAAEYKVRTEKAEAELKSLRSDLEKPFADLSELQVPVEFSELEKKTEAVLAEKTAIYQAEAELAEEVVQRKAALDDLPEEIAEIEQTLSISVLPPEPKPSGEIDAEYAAWLAESEARASLEAKLKAKKSELSFLHGSEEWISARRDFLVRETARLSRNAEFYSEKLAAAREMRATKAVQIAEEAAESVKTAGDSKLTAIAQENLRLSNLRTGPDGLLARSAGISATLSQIEGQLQQIGDQYSSARRRLDLLDSAGLTIDEETGETLRQQRGLLPLAADLKRRLGIGVREAATNQLELIKLEELRRQLLLDFNKRIDADGAERAAELLAAQRDTLGVLIRDTQTLQSSLEARNRALKRLLDLTNEFRNYLNEKLVWIRSAPVLSWRDITTDLSACIEFVTSHSVRDWLDAVVLDFLTFPVLWILMALTVGYLVYKRGHLKTLIERDGRAAVMRSCRSMNPTFRSLVFSLLRVATVLIPLWFLIWRTYRTSSAIALGLISVAIVLTVLLIVLELNRCPHGLIVAHFGRNPELAEDVRRNFTWMAYLLPLPLFFAGVLLAVHQTGGRGRLFFIVALIIVLVVVYRLLVPSKGLLEAVGIRSPYGRIVYILGHMAPIALIVGAALGYFTSMRNLSTQMLVTVIIIFATVFVAAYFHRWVLVSRRKVAARQAAAKRKAEADLESAKVSDVKSEQKPQQSLQEIENQAASLARVQDDTRKLIRVMAMTLALLGMWAVWSPSLPALSAFDRVSMWAVDSSTPAPDPSADGAGDTAKSDLAIPGMSESSSDQPKTIVGNDKDFVSLQDVIVAVFLLVIFFFLARQLPSIFELLVFQRLNLEPGGAFAFSTILRYLLIGIGVFMVCSRLQIEWSKVQWIAAAITFGIGFGLQEIFANFVAGIIILFERPLRLGDFVTLEDVSGHVTKIRIRATTIRDFSNKELVVPNREFITGKLVNWTLTDPVIRVEILVGIAYGSDTRLAEKILLKTAHENPIVIDQPAPSVAFRNFGESSLDFELRVNIKDSNMLVPVQSQLRFEIDRAFREANIEIAFPQRDLHIRSVDREVGAALRLPPSDSTN